MNKVFLLIGGNMGDRLQNLHQAIAHLSAAVGPVLQQSAVYETAAWGKTDQSGVFKPGAFIEHFLKRPGTDNRRIAGRREHGPAQNGKVRPTGDRYRYYVLQ